MEICVVLSEMMFEKLTQKPKCLYSKDQTAAHSVQSDRDLHYLLKIIESRLPALGSRSCSDISAHSHKF